MKEVICTSSLYCLGFLGIRQERFSKNEWIISNEISIPFIEDIVENKYKVCFLQNQNIFSHEMNVLRKAIETNKTKVIIGAQAIYSHLNQAAYFTIDSDANIIIIEDVVYKFRGFNCYSETSELIEYNIDNNAICYRPDYYYHYELAEIIANGYTKAGKDLLGRFDFYANYGKDGRVWCINGLFPSELTQCLISNLSNYYRNIYAYMLILSEINSIALELHNDSNLKGLLTDHFKHSVLFSFSLPYLTQRVIDLEGYSKMEQIYSIFVKNTPIQGKGKSVENAIYNMKTLMMQLTRNPNNYNEVMQTCFPYETVIVLSTEDILMFTANMVSDLRRSVINRLRRNNKWFESICGHRKKTTLY